MAPGSLPGWGGVPPARLQLPGHLALADWDASCQALFLLAPHLVIAERSPAAREWPAGGELGLGGGRRTEVGRPVGRHWDPLGREEQRLAGRRSDGEPLPMELLPGRLLLI